MRTTCALAALLAWTAQITSAVVLNVKDNASIKSAASVIAFNLMKSYTGNITNTPSTIGVLPPPIYWWEAGALWGAMLDYYHYTGDASYNEVTTQALLSQLGPLFDYMVPAQEKDEGNDDQGFWGFATMSAAEKGYPEPSEGGYTWLQLTENLWNTQVRRWDMSSCGGGLKWQIFTFNNGFNYKNSVSNGAFFQLSARLARFTGNQTYVDWATKSLEWSFDVGLITPDYHIFDGTDDTLNCTEQDHIQWSYNLGIYMYGSAMLYNYTNGSTMWAEHTQGFLNATPIFFSPFENSTNVMFESACEPIETCDIDQYSFKGYLGRFMWATTLVAPFTASTISNLLTRSASAAAQACSGGEDSGTCGQKWYVGGFDGKSGIGQQMSALEVIQGLLVPGAAPPMHSDNVHVIIASPPKVKLQPTLIPTTLPTQTTGTTKSTKKSTANGAVGANLALQMTLALSSLGWLQFAFGNGV